MMKAVANLTRPYHVHTLVSLNTVMVDGTGMCGGCRVTVNGEMKFACVDGPEFDGHMVDFDELMMRNRTYNEMERISEEKHACRLAAITQESVR
jgi:ferredoxin--NADP+ reductase